MELGESFTDYSPGPTESTVGDDPSGAGDTGDINTSGRTYVGWQWLAGTAFSNDAGSNGATIPSSGRVNTTAGFSIVSWVGTGVNGTISHGLGSLIPKWVIVKNYILKVAKKYYLLIYLIQKILKLIKT